MGQVFFNCLLFYYAYVSLQHLDAKSEIFCVKADNPAHVYSEVNGISFVLIKAFLENSTVTFSHIQDNPQTLLSAVNIEAVPKVAKQFVVRSSIQVNQDMVSEQPS